MRVARELSLSHTMCARGRGRACVRGRAGRRGVSRKGKTVSRAFGSSITPHIFLCISPIYISNVSSHVISISSSPALSQFTQSRPESSPVPPQTSHAKTSCAQSAQRGPTPVTTRCRSQQCSSQPIPPQRPTARRQQNRREQVFIASPEANRSLRANSDTARVSRTPRTRSSPHDASASGPRFGSRTGRRSRGNRTRTLSPLSPRKTAATFQETAAAIFHAATSASCVPSSCSQRSSALEFVQLRVKDTAGREDHLA